MDKLSILIEDLKKAVEIDSFIEQKGIKTTKTESSVEKLIKYGIENKIIKTTDDLLKVCKEVGNNISEVALTFLFSNYLWKRRFEEDDRC